MNVNKATSCKCIQLVLFFQVWGVLFYDFDVIPYEKLPFRFGSQSRHYILWATTSAPDPWNP